MRRDLSAITSTTFDLLVVGGGIQGAWIAWDASLRGLSVALVERDDFGAGISANSLRIVHGGLRYLTRGDLPRMRESIRERSTLLRIAPRWVRPLPVVVPTHGAGLESRRALGAALRLNDLVSRGRNRGLLDTHQLPNGRLISREECVRLFPGFAPMRLDGGALWYDARIEYPERLILAILRAASERGAVLGNYLDVVGIVVDGGAVRGVRAVDRPGGGELHIGARSVAVAAGPRTGGLVASAAGRSAAAIRRPGYALGMNIVVGRRLAEAAIGLRARSGPAEDPVCGGGRFLFLVPDGDLTMIGTWYAPCSDETGSELLERGAETLLREVNDVCPALRLTPGDVVRWHAGQLPLKAGVERGRPDALADRPRVVDHGARGNARGLFAVETVKFTTARHVAEQAVDRVLATLKHPEAGSRTARTPLPCDPPPPEDHTSPGLPGSSVRRSEIVRAIREEMALTLADVAVRRTDLAAPPGPSRSTLVAVAQIAGEELGWDEARQTSEVETLMRGLLGSPPAESVA